MIDENWWKQYENKYGKLMWKISGMISGDPMLTSLEDNYNELCVAALDSILGFKQLTGREIKDFLDDKEFDQYTKTVLWHRKSNIGSPISKRLKIAKILNESVLDVSSNVNPDESDGFLDTLESSSSSYNVYEDISTELTEEEKRFLKEIINNPQVLLLNGTVDLIQISKALDISYYLAKKLLKSLQDKMRLYEKS